ncbi:hypothetical protein TWF706_001707 [Orbilia oligospora]|nr:hypothetical protein TWF706_001707 [Orbilia oligospora]
MARHGSKLKPKGSTDEENPKLANDSRGQNPIPGLPMNAAAELPDHLSVPPIMQPPRGPSRLIPACLKDSSLQRHRDDQATPVHGTTRAILQLVDGMDLGRIFETRDATKDVVCGTNKDGISVSAMPQHRREYAADLCSYVPLRRYCSVRVFGPGQYMQQYTILYLYGFHVQRIPTSTLSSCSKVNACILCMRP